MPARSRAARALQDELPALAAKDKRIDAPLKSAQVLLSHELLTVSEKLGHPTFDLAGELVDRDEEGHLPLSEHVQDLAVVLGDLEDALTVGDELDRRQLLFEVGVTP